MRELEICEAIIADMKDDEFYAMCDDFAGCDSEELDVLIENLANFGIKFIDGFSYEKGDFFEYSGVDRVGDPELYNQEKKDHLVMYMYYLEI
jgi:hypothetical protein